MKVRVTHTIGDLARDAREVVHQSRRDMRTAVRSAARDGNNLAKTYARESSGEHARLYPGTFTVGAVTQFAGADAGAIAVEYGPTLRGQGGLAPILENGSRNNPAHNNLAKSADLAGDFLANEVRRLPSKWFWS